MHKLSKQAKQPGCIEKLNQLICWCLVKTLTLSANSQTIGRHLVSNVRISRQRHHDFAQVNQGGWLVFHGKDGFVTAKTEIIQYIFCKFILENNKWKAIFLWQILQRGEYFQLTKTITWLWRWLPKVVETADTNNSPSQDSNQPDDLFQSKYFTCPVIAIAGHTLCFESTFKKFPKGIHRNQDWLQIWQYHQLVVLWFSFYEYRLMIVINRIKNCYIFSQVSFQGHLVSSLIDSTFSSPKKASAIKLVTSVWFPPRCVQATGTVWLAWFVFVIALAYL